MSSIPDFHEDEPTKKEALYILLGKGSSIYNHSGNKRFRAIINNNVHKYRDASLRKQKTELVTKVFGDMKTSGFRFLKKDGDGVWRMIYDSNAREKLSHALRDRLREIRKSTRRRRNQTTALKQKKLKELTERNRQQATQVLNVTPWAEIQTLEQLASYEAFGANQKKLLAGSLQKTQPLQNFTLFQNTLDSLNSLAHASQKVADDAFDEESLFGGLANEIADAETDGLFADLSDEIKKMHDNCCDQSDTSGWIRFSSEDVIVSE